MLRMRAVSLLALGFGWISTPDARAADDAEAVDAHCKILERVCAG